MSVVLPRNEAVKHMVPFFPFCVLESELIGSNSLFFTNLFRANITVKTLRNLTKQLYWLFTKEIIALTNLLLYRGSYFIPDQL